MMIRKAHCLSRNLTLRDAQNPFSFDHFCTFSKTVPSSGLFVPKERLSVCQLFSALYEVAVQTPRRGKGASGLRCSQDAVAPAGSLRDLARRSPAAAL